MRPLRPMMGAIARESAWRETHQGIPLLIRAWMLLCWFSALYIVCIPLSILDARIGYGAAVILSQLQAFPRWNFLVPLGFRLFSWTIRQD